METKGWDVFRVLPPENDSSSEANQKWLGITVKILKVFAYFLTFTVLLVCGVVTKGTTLFMASQIKQGRTIEFCNQYGDKRSGTDYDFKRNQEYEAQISTTERVAWP